VPLDARPQDHRRPELTREARSVDRLRERRIANRVFGRRQSALPVAMIQMRPGRNCVDPVTVERLTYVVEILGRELLRVVELVVVDQVPEPLDRRPDL